MSDILKLQNPLKFLKDDALVDLHKDYISLQAKGVRDEIFIMKIENELSKRNIILC